MLGLGTALLILAQATLLAPWSRTRSTAPHRADVARDVAAARRHVRARGVLAWGFEVAGRRAAATPCPGSGWSSPSSACATQPAALDGTEAAEVATASVQGVDGLEAYFGRYLPQLVLAAIVPIAVLARVASIDPSRRPR